VRPDGGIDTLTFGELRSARTGWPTRSGRGRRAGDRVAVLLQQGVAVPIAHAAIYKLGAIALPLASVFGTDALAYRLADSGAKALITGRSGPRKIATIRDLVPALETILSIHGPDGIVEGFSKPWRRLRPTSPQSRQAPTTRP
jgi:acetyl-CoA synthetase